MSRFAELVAATNFSFLHGASHPQEMVAQAAELGLAAIAIADRNSLAGVVRAHETARDLREHGNDIQLIVGARLVTTDGAEVVCLPTDRAAYGRLCRLLTAGNRRAPKGECHISFPEILAAAEGQIFIALPPHSLSNAFTDRLKALAAAAPERAYLAASFRYRGDERRRLGLLAELAEETGTPLVATNDARYHTPDRRPLADVLTCIRNKCTIAEAGFRLEANAERHLKDGREMARLFAAYPDAVARTLAIAEQTRFSLEELRYEYPEEPVPAGRTPQSYLEELTWRHAAEHYPDGVPAKVQELLRKELSIIAELDYARYFLTVYDIVRFAKDKGILCQGRGSAANSAVCYCLGITAVDPIKLELLFERFLSEERAEAPDIDIDFAHRERERVLQYVYRRYGRDHAAMVCEHITWRGRSAVRDAARVLGFSPEQAGLLASFSDRFSAKNTAAALRLGAKDADPFAPERVDALGPANYSKRALDNPRDVAQRRNVHPVRAATVVDAVASDLIVGTHASNLVKASREEHRQLRAIRGGAPVERRTVPKPGDEPSLLERANLDPRDPRVQRLADIVEQLDAAPRHRGIHVGGFVLTEEPLHTVVPIEPASMEDRSVIQWEKDDLDPVGLVKIDLLGLGMLTVLQDCLAYIRRTRGVVLDLGQLDCADQAVYDDLCKADSIGVFQVESRAQMNTLPRLKPRSFYDLVVEVALIRPGPIQGEMVHPYLRRRAGVEEVTYPHPALESILKRTLGVPLFQEQGMQVAIAAAGFTPGEADLLRKAMGHKRSRERMADICQRMIDGMRANGIPEDVAMRIYNQINGFADYGFPESHAASFALIVYASAYLRHYYAPEFLCAMLNAQPMGFYAPGTLIEDARRHGVRLRSVDVTRSQWDHTLEPGNGRNAAPVVRLGLRSVLGLGSQARQKIEQAYASGERFTSIADFVKRSKLDRRSLRALAEAGAFDAFVQDEPPARRRRVALWRVLEAEREAPGPLALFPESSVPAVLPGFSAPELTEADYRLTGLSLNGHPMRHLRSLLAPNGVKTSQEILAMRDGEAVAHAGLVICRQRPGTAKGFVFLTLEDETGTINVVVTPQRFEEQAMVVARSPLLLVRGILQVESGVYNIRAQEFTKLEAKVGEDFVKGYNFR